PVLDETEDGAGRRGEVEKAEKLYQEEGRKRLSGKPGAGMNGKRVQKFTSCEIAHRKRAILHDFCI
ncbi:hypothetical protein, partial [Clostridium sp.]